MAKKILKRDITKYFFASTCRILSKWHCLKKEIHMKIQPENYTGAFKGKKLECITLSNAKGMCASFCNYGARILQILVPCANGTFHDVTLGYGSFNDALQGMPEMGATIGRCANRIRYGAFCLDGITYQLAQNDGKNHLHGGNGGVMRRMFHTEHISPHAVRFTVTLADGEDGYPGNVRLSVCYTLCDANALHIEYSAKCDKATPLNICNHAYFNLGTERSILEHELSLNALFYTPVDEGLIPTGEIAAVANTPFDFSLPQKLGARISQNDEQLGYGRGYDHNFILDKTAPKNPSFPTERLAATVFAASTVCEMKIYTTEPGIQFYSGNFIGQNATPGRRPMPFRSGFCLETQHFPDSVNQPSFPNVILRPEENFFSSTTYSFATRNA